MLQFCYASAAQLRITHINKILISGRKNAALYKIDYDLDQGPREFEVHVLSEGPAHRRAGRGLTYELRAGRETAGPNMQRQRPVMLVILDGWGWREDVTDNAIRQAHTPHLTIFGTHVRTHSCVHPAPTQQRTGPADIDRTSPTERRCCRTLVDMHQKAIRFSL